MTRFKFSSVATTKASTRPAVIPFEADRVIAEAVARGALAARAPGCAGAQMAVRPRALFQTVPAVESVFLNTL
jgi:hypothetical protein